METTQTLQFDIMVAGGGVAGCAAALQAARQGKQVVLVEKAVQLGGLATTGIVNLFEPMCNGRGTQIIKGMAQEFLDLARRYGWDDLPAEWQQGEPGQGNTNRRLICHYSAPIFALVLCKLLSDAGVTLMFDTVVTDVEARKGHIYSATVFNKSGYTRLCAGMYIDTTGDADLLHYAGVPTAKQGNYHTYAGYGLNLDTCQKAVENRDVGKLYFDIPGGNASRTGKNHPEGMPLWDGTDGEQVSRYFQTNQLEVLSRIQNDDRKSRDIVMLPAMHQFRTTRHIIGNHVLQKEDVFRHFEDSVGAIGDCMSRDAIYEVPYGTLVRDDWDNILTAGRSAAAEGYAWEVLRVIPPAILTGQAAGLAAAMALDAGCPISQVEISPLQKALAATGVIIHFDDALIPPEAK